eukprot:ctg_126.g74
MGGARSAVAVALARRWAVVEHDHRWRLELLAVRLYAHQLDYGRQSALVPQLRVDAGSRRLGGYGHAVHGGGSERQQLQPVDAQRYHRYAAEGRMDQPVGDRRGDRHPSPRPLLQLDQRTGRSRHGSIRLQGVRGGPAGRAQTGSQTEQHPEGRSLQSGRLLHRRTA